jgi:transposase-like protein
MSDNGKVQVSLDDTQVEPRAVRRQYTAEYKQRILDELDRAQEPGELGAILRREGLYSQIISKWRQQRQKGELKDSRQAKRGRKANPQVSEVARLKAENERLRARLERAKTIIEVQKKVSRLLGMDENESEDLE